MPETEATASSSTAAAPVLEVDPLLRDLREKKQTFRRNVVSLAAELKEARSRLASQEQSFAKETVTRQEAESRAMNMKVEMDRLQKSLEDINMQLQASTSACENHAKDLDDLRLQLSETKATADASSVSAQSAQLQCATMVRELEEKNCSLKEHESRVYKLGEKLNNLHQDLQAREFSQMLFVDEVSRVELEILQALAKTGANKDCELQKILGKFSQKDFEKIDKLLSLKDDEISKLRDEVRVMSTHWKLKTAELESQLEKHYRADQDLKKKVLKLEFCLQDVRAHTRKLQRMEERRDKDFQELRDQLAAREQKEPVSNEKKNLWDTFGFKIVVSMSMLILIMFSKR